VDSGTTLRSVNSMGELDDAATLELARLPTVLTPRVDESDGWPVRLQWLSSGADGLPQVRGATSSVGGWRPDAVGPTVL
jgi:hypothetical protein